MSAEDRLHRMMSNVGQSDVDQSTWADFVSVAHRDRSKHRLVTAVAVVGAVVAASFGTAAVLNQERTDRDLRPTDQSFAPVPIPVDVPRDCPTPPDVTEGAFGTVAYLGATELHVVDVASGDDSILVQGGPGFGEGFFSDEVRISPDGQWVSFGGGLMVPTAGGDLCAPLGVGLHDLQWTPDGRAVALSDGSLIVGGPGREPIPIAPEFDGTRYEGYAFESFVLSPDGERAAVAAVGKNQADLWVVDFRTMPEVVRFSVSAEEFGGVSVAGWDPDGRWVLFWNTYPDSESLNADGSPLRAVNLATGEVTTITDYMVSERDQMAWCGDRLVFTDGIGRLVQDKKVIAEAQPPSWDKGVLRAAEGVSYVDPACDGPGRNLAAIETATAGSSVSSLLRWTDGGGELDGLLPPSGRGFLHPQLSQDGTTVVAELTTDKTGVANEVVVIDGEGMRTLGILGAQSSFPLMGGSPTWDWHHP